MSFRYHAVIFGGASQGTTPGQVFFSRSIGPYRLRTHADQFGFRTKVIDFTESCSKEALKELIDRYFEKGTLVYGLSTTFMNPDHVDLLLDPELLEYARSRSGSRLQIVSGGALATARRRQSIDWYLTGYAETGYVELLKHLSGSGKAPGYELGPNGEKTIVCNRDYPYKDVSNLGTKWLAEDFIKPHEVLPVEIARGCIFKCSFCSYPLNGKKKFDYIRPQADIVTEMNRNHREFGVDKYFFMDDTYNDSEVKMKMMHSALSGLEKEIRFCAYIKPELLSTWPHHVDWLLESGLEGASLGLETFNPRTRTLIKKGPELEKILETLERMQEKSGGRLGISGNFIIGLPDEPLSSVEMTQKWLLQNSHIINSVSWRPLWILDPGLLAYASEIELNPEKYGYKTQAHPQARPGVRFWSNEHMNFDIAMTLADRFTHEVNAVKSLAGWEIGLMRNFGVYDVDQMLRQRVRYPEISWGLVKKARQKFFDEYFEFQKKG